MIGKQNCLGLLVCCCRCAGRCGGRPTSHYDKKSDSCRRLCTGLLMSLVSGTQNIVYRLSMEDGEGEHKHIKLYYIYLQFVVAATLGCASAFLTCLYTRWGWEEVPGRLNTSLADTKLWLGTTGRASNNLLVTNFKQAEQVCCIHHLKSS